MSNVLKARTHHPGGYAKVPLPLPLPLPIAASSRWKDRAVVIFVVLNVLNMFYKIEQIKDNNTLFRVIKDSVGPSPTLGYVVFRDFDSQGRGNVMHGLLATQMLAREYNRELCIDWDDFDKAFISLNGKKGCKEAIKANPEDGETNKLTFFNYFRPDPSECLIHRLLSSNQTVIYVKTNMYPRWGSIPAGLWDQHYTPTEELMRTLPYQNQPETVVHLRAPDTQGDKRQGLDNETLHALGKKLPKDTFLVTNNIDWYKFYEQYGWKNPGWHKIRHSASNKVGQSWGKATGTVSAEEAKMQLWSDWYTMLKARHVYHTHSDFSLSAIHWNEIDSKTIQGTQTNGELLLANEYWRNENSSLPLKDRPALQLKGCSEEAERFMKMQ